MTMRWRIGVVALLVSCGLVTDPPPLEELGSEITGFRVCEGERRCEIAGEYIDTGNPRNASAVPWRRPFVAEGELNWARWLSWRLEWATCRTGASACSTTRPLRLKVRARQRALVEVTLWRKQPHWLILVAELADRVIADTVRFDPPDPWPFSGL